MSTVTSRSASEPHQLYKTALIGTLGLLGYAVYRGWDRPVEQLVLALVCMALSIWPALRWLRTQPYPLPAFEVFMLTFVPFYALQLLTEHEAVVLYSDRTIFRAMVAVLLFQVSALLAFYRTRPLPRQTPFWNSPLFTYDISRWLPIGLWLSAGYTCVSFFTDWLPGEINSILRAVFFGIATSCTFLLGRKWGAGELAKGSRLNVGAALICTALLQMSNLYLISATASVLIFFLAYISAGRRIPVVALGVIFLILTVLHNGKSPMRDYYWAIGAPERTLTDLPGFYLEWVEHGLKPFQGEDDRVERRELLERTSLLHILCLVVESTDRGLPFMAGETYGYVAASLVPRILWPDKPPGSITTQRLSIHFLILDEASAETTSIAFGVLAEAYANFAYWGVALLGVFIGWANKVVAIWTRHSPLLSSGGLIMILLIAWSIQVEMPLSSWVSSFYQAAICVLGVPYVLKRLFN